MKKLPVLSTLLAAAALAITPLAAQEQNQKAPAAPAKPARPSPKLTPKQQITSFYAMCKQNRGGEGLREMLSSNPVVQEGDVQRVATAFSELIKQMGGFIDFAIVKEAKLSDRVQVVRCIAHFDRQPFLNEFSFYDPGSGEWRLVHLRYDANLATMFQEDVRAAE